MKKYSPVVLCLFLFVSAFFAFPQLTLAAENSYSVDIQASEGLQINPVGVQAAQEGEEINLNVLPASPDVIPFLIVDGARKDLEQVGGEFRLPLHVTGKHTVLATTDITPSKPARTKFMNATKMGQLRIASKSGSTWVLTCPLSTLPSVAVGNILVGAPTTRFPNGLLRKVTSVSKSSTTVTMSTVQATLEEALQNAQVQKSKTLSSDTVQSVDFMKTGVSLRNAPEGQMLQEAMAGLVFDLFDVVLYDHDGNLETKDDQIKATGNVSIVPTINFYMKVRDFKLQNLMFTETITETTELAINGDITLYEISEKVEIARVKFSPIVVWVGGIPVVLVPVFTVNVGLDGNVTVGLTAMVSQTATMTSGVSYNQGVWSPVSSFSNSFAYEPPVLSAEAQFRGYVAPDLSLNLYGVAGPYVNAQGYLELLADLFADPWWELYAGLEADVGVRVKVLSKTLADYHLADLIDYRVLLADSNTFDIPDLTVNSVIFNSSSGKMEAQIANMGWSSTGTPFNVKCFKGYSQIYSGTLGPLGGGATTAVSFTPPSSGTYSVSCTADVLSQVAESNESNNARTAVVTVPLTGEAAELERLSEEAVEATKAGIAGRRWARF